VLSRLLTERAWDRYATPLASKDEAAPAAEPRDNWWSSATCLAHYNAGVCDEPLTSNSEGCRRRLARLGRRFERAVSVGCGDGTKEIALLVDGLVASFDLWEISPRLAEAGMAAARRAGVEQGVTYRVGDVFAARGHPTYDLVYWDHSLHHMSDVNRALKWSVEVLAPGGVVLVNDYVGPNRLQFTRPEVEAVNRFLERHAIPERHVHTNLLTKLRQWKRDPSEAPQSELILAAVERWLPGAEIRPLGGVALNMMGGVIVPRAAEGDPLLDALVAEDAKLRDRGLNHFAFALWQKPVGPADASAAVADDREVMTAN
jgi:SAM-dependent methyltransferase